MSKPDPFSNTSNEADAEKAFSKQSASFDTVYSSDTIIRYKRERVRTHVENYLKPSSNILELNAGTGEDAVYFAQHGHRVHATDISKDMIKVLARKVKTNDLADIVSAEVCSYTQLEKLSDKGPYDLIFSNFAGLNCTSELDKVLSSFDPLVKPDGIITLVLLPEFCLWETLLLFKGKFKTAFRRFFADKPARRSFWPFVKAGGGARAHIEGVYFKCWYYNPSYIIDRLEDSFEVCGLEGLCTVVPPSYIEHFAEKRPKVYEFLKKKKNS